jgi:hypothetical protein
MSVSFSSATLVTTTDQCSPPNHPNLSPPSPRAAASATQQLTINTDLSPEALKKIYWGLGPENKWMECIDGTHQRFGKNVYDKGLHGKHAEPGFVRSMEEAFPFIENSLSLKIDAGWYLLLHKYTCAHFNGDKKAMMLMGQEKIGMFRDSDDEIEWRQNLACYVVTPEARCEFQALDEELKREFGDYYGLGEITFSSDKEIKIFSYKVMEWDQVRRIFDKFLNEFYEEVEKAATYDEKLMAIAKLHQRLEWLHPPKDGTARTNTALMNKHLTDYGFHPAILEYPHVSSTYGLQQWFEYLKDGLKKWEEKKASLFNPLSLNAV